MSEKIFKIILDDQNKTKMKLDSNSFLSDARIKLKEKISQNFSFIDAENFPLEIELEKELKVSDLNTGTNIILKSINKNEIKGEIKLNVKREINPLPEAKLIKKERNIEYYQYPRIQFSPMEESKANIVLIVGQTGSGKTTFINSFVNYLMDIELTDNFRYSLIIENERIKTESQTKGLHIYNIRSKKLLVKLIDTQGFGDTGGISEDDKITLAIKDAFMNELNSINTILFVVKSSDTRLTSHQKYIFSSIISLFGKDIKKNFLALITFFNGTTTPSAVMTLEQSDFKDIIPSIEKPWYICFDSNLIFGDPEDELVSVSYNRAKKNYKLLCDKINSLDRKSLQLSKKNLDLREKIRIRCSALEELLKSQMDKLGEIDDQKKFIEDNEKKINSNEIKYIPKKRIEMEPEKLSNNQKATICKVCKFNCHNPCMDTTIGGYDVLKYTCKIWSWGFNCMCCPNNCSQSCHELSDEIYVRKEYTDYIKVDSISKSNENIKGISLAKDMLKQLEKEERELKAKIKITQEEIKQKYAELKKIAINYTSYQTTIEFLKELMEEEKRNREEGFEKRIHLYEKMIKENEHLLTNM